MAPKIKKRHKTPPESAKQASPPNMASSATGQSHDDPEDPSVTCSICAERVSDWAVGACAHVICGDCAHRMRVLYDRKTCVMCNEVLRQVAVVPLRHYRNAMTFEEAVSLPGAFQDKQVDMWFTDRVRHQQLRRVRGFKCSQKACSNRPPQESVFANATQLRAHARSEHRTIYCEICFTGKKMFISEMPQYSLDNERNYSSRLRGHLRKDHPQCKFCRHYYLDDEKLYTHLQERHETCSICERNGRMHEYYLNFERLERHYAKEHYVCRQESCRGVVFATQIELQSHEHRQHNESNRGNRSRTLRVDLTQLHGARDPRRSSAGTVQEIERERERQAARRRAFLSSNVVFSGAFNLDDTAANPLPGEAPEGPSEQTAQTSQLSPREDSSSAADEARAARRPDDGHFHPLVLPRNTEELNARNTLLVRAMRSILDPAAYEQFKHASGQFHVGNISADEYYDAAIDAFGVRAAVRDILPELVALLPSHLLREPLLQTCLRRTDTKLERVGYSQNANGASSYIASGSFNSTNTQEEQFPSLVGSPVPQRSTAKAARFGTAGPEEFPRLNPVSRSQERPDSQQAPSRGQPEQPTYATASSIAQTTANVGSTKPQQRAAASVLRQPPATHRRGGSKTGVGSASGTTSSAEAQIHERAFPALTAADVTTRRAQNWPVRRHDQEQERQSDESLPTDLSMRVGAVWGGAAARAHDRTGRKRGPGKGQGKRPASPPKPVTLKTSDFPNIRESSGPADAGQPSSTQSETSSSRDLSSGGSSLATPRKNKVVDIMEAARTRQKAVAKSNLPKIGGSGYGFAWDRKKVQRKKREIKESASEQTSKNTNLNSHGCFERGSSSILATTENSEDNSAEAEQITSISPSTNLTAEESVPSTDVNEETLATTSDATEDPRNFDPYAYLKDNVPADDMVASFLGGTK